ncbi:MAG: UDP-glucose/GDP-mannose dehydrogenase family protein [Candidatus Eremiobacteraeota bacterium]|nr:UDP-glucose/GDP-mannose dehydrogenase family protein [Candidatus Eremiobacteraeota bacterium]
MNICMLGSGYVGLVTGACFADLGNNVVCIDTDSEKVAVLDGGNVPFYEPGLAETVARNVAQKRLKFSAHPGEGIRGADVVFIAVGTPTGDDGRADLKYVRAAATDIAKYMDGNVLVVNKSTVPVETGDLVHEIIMRERTTLHGFSVVSNPEFLREGSAIADFMNPDRIVIGVSNPEAEAAMRLLYEPINAPIIVTEIHTAEMIKYTANAFLATKISFINEIARICENVGADVVDVVNGAGSDRRIGAAFLNPGLGFGGSCLPKDVLALVRVAEQRGLEPELLRSVLRVNAEQIDWIVDSIEERAGGLAGRRIAVLGLAFKPNTDDVRDSPAITLAAALAGRGATVIATDPIAGERAKALMPESIDQVSNCYEAADDADVLVLATEWNEYKQINFKVVRKLMRGNLVFDARNIYNASRVNAEGLSYAGVGRPAATCEPTVDAAANIVPMLDVDVLCA